jgi:mannose-6-phosphate isomerase-like protein (cupin superfamily)
MTYYHGNFYNDSEEHPESRGWIVGQFLDVGKGARKTEKVEIKFWKFRKGEDTKHTSKHQKSALECTLILKGRVSGEIDGEAVVLEENDYVVIPPGIENNFPTQILEDVVGLTIKAPSVQGDDVKASQ